MLLSGALASTVNGTLAPETSSIENLFSPPDVESFAVSCQSFDGYVPVDVSSNLMRMLFSFSRMVSKPKLSLLTQSNPTHRLDCTMRSSATTWSLVAPSSTSLVSECASGAMMEPDATRNAPVTEPDSPPAGGNEAPFRVATPLIGQISNRYCPSGHASALTGRLSGSPLTNKTSRRKAPGPVTRSCIAGASSTVSNATTPLPATARASWAPTIGARASP